MTELNKVFHIQFPPPPTYVQHKEFYFNEKIKERYITANIMSYAYMKETGYRIFAGLNDNSYAYIREHRP